MPISRPTVLHKLQDDGVKIHAIGKINDIFVGIIDLESLILANALRRSSGIATSPTLGSIVQKGKFAA